MKPVNSKKTPPLFATVLEEIRSNPSYFFCFFSFLIIGAIALTNIQKGDLLLYFNANRSTFGDLFFKYFTKAGEEAAYVGLMLLFFFLHQRRMVYLIPLTGLIVTIISYLSKSYFLHPRPSEFYKQLSMFNELNLIEGVHVVKGLSSFPSGHTMSGFALFTLLALWVKEKRFLGFFFFLCALFVGLSRVYLVQHFLEDIYLGGIMGVGIGLMVYVIQKKLFAA